MTNKVDVVDRAIETLHKIAIYRDDEGGMIAEVGIIGNKMIMSQKGMTNSSGTTQQNIVQAIAKVCEEQQLDPETIYKQYLYMAPHGQTYTVKGYWVDFATQVMFKIDTVAANRFKQWVGIQIAELMNTGGVFDRDRLKRNPWKLVA